MTSDLACPRVGLDGWHRAKAIARDLLTHTLHTLDKAGHGIVMHVHDEAGIDEPPPHDSAATVESVCALMATPPVWARGLPLDADSYECSFYMRG